MFYDLQHADDTACLIDDAGDVCNYAQLRSNADAFADALKPIAPATSDAASNDSAIEPQVSRPLVLLLCNNSVGAISCYLGALRSNAVVMLLGDSVDQSLLDEVLRIYQPNYIAQAAGEAAAELEGSEIIFSQLGYQVNAYSAEPAELHADLALMLSTSGSTGSPKFVRLSRQNIQANAESIAAYLQLSPLEKAITVLPMTYSYGLSVINSHLQAGAQLVITDHSLMTKEFWALFTEQQVTSLSGVPYTYEMLQRLRFERRDLSHLTSMTQAGGKMAPEMIKHFADLAEQNDIRFFVMYGQTEATARISYVPSEMLADKCGSIGVAIPGGQLELRALTGDAGSQVTNGEEGELIYRGPNVMMGYAETRADLAGADAMQGELATGDLGRCDEDGFYYVTGRIKRIIKMFGNRVNLDDIDKHLQALQVEGVAGGEDNMLKVGVTAEADVEPVKQSLVDTFKFDHRSVEVFHLPTIPRNDAGKIQYGKIFAVAS